MNLISDYLLLLEFFFKVFMLDGKGEYWRGGDSGDLKDCVFKFLK